VYLAIDFLLTLFLAWFAAFAGTPLFFVIGMLCDRYKLSAPLGAIPFLLFDR
jgi:F0F1-type ATP synthase assembly protein I